MDKVLGVIYLSIVAIIVIVYLLYAVYEWICRIAYKKALKRIREASVSPDDAPVVDVVGKTTTVFLAPLKTENNAPFMSEDLEPERSEANIETEQDISPEYIEVKQNQLIIPNDDELDDFSDSNSTTDELSKGLTFEQISHALEVVEGRKSGENDAQLAGETFSIMPDDFLNVICMQPTHEEKVKRLISCYVDAIGKPPTTVADFDINKYV